MFPGWRRRKPDDKKLSLCLLVFILRKLTAEGYNSSSHKTDSISSIPWNLLLDPSYTSHKITPTAVSKNQVLFSPPNYGQSVASTSSVQLWQRPQSSSATPGSYSPKVHYTTSPSSTSSSTESAKYSIRIPNTYEEQPLLAYPSHYHSEYHSNKQESGPPRQNPPAHYERYLANKQHQKDLQNYRYEAQDSNRVTFPDRGGGGGNYNSAVYATSAPYEKNNQPKKKKLKTSKNKEKTRKPEDYFNFDDDHENSYQDYEDSYSYPYAETSSKDQRHPHSSYSTGGNDFPYGIVSSSSSNNILNKAKDLLKFGSHSKPSYSISSSSSDHYPKQSPQKQYDEYEEPPDPYASYHSSYGLDGSDDEYYSKGEYVRDPSSLYYYPPDYYDNHALGDGKYDGPPVAIAQKKKGSKIGPLAFALGLLPLGLLLASLVPTVVTIPVTTAVATGRKRKRREVEFVNPVLDTIDSYGVQSLEDPMCLQRIFCSVVVGGKQNRSSIIQKLYYKGAAMLDEKWADYVGLKMLLRAVKREQCELFPCQAKKSTHDASKQKLKPFV